MRRVSASGGGVYAFDVRVRGKWVATVHLAYLSTISRADLVRDLWTTTRATIRAYRQTYQTEFA